MSSTSAPVSSIMSAAPKSAKVVAKKSDVAAAPVAAPVAAAPVKAVKAKKAEVAAPVAAAPVAPVSAPVVAEEVVEEVRLEAEVKSVTARLLAVRETLSELISESKRLEKKATKLQKTADKRRRRKVVEGEDGKPARLSIFQIPTNISPALCAFMGRPAGSQESRSNVTKFVTTYVKEHNLKDKHAIHGDAKLLKLLNLKAEDSLTYFNLQKYLNVHYLKAEKPTA